MRRSRGKRRREEKNEDERRGAERKRRRGEEKRSVDEERKEETNEVVCECRGEREQANFQFVGEGNCNSHLRCIQRPSPRKSQSAEVARLIVFT